MKCHNNKHRSRRMLNVGACAFAVGLTAAFGTGQLPAEYDEVFHVLRRITNGPRLGDALPMVQNTAELQAYIDLQLTPDLIVESHPDLAGLLSSIRPAAGGEWTLDQVVREHIALGLYSDKQLQHVLGYFWRRHFNTSYDAVLGKLGIIITIYPNPNQLPDMSVEGQTAELIRNENNFFRDNALESFEELLFGSAEGPPMLIYLDSVANIAMAGMSNENYARELLELHTLGLDENGEPEHYSQEDILALADVFSGWSIAPDEDTVWRFNFRSGAHVDTEDPLLFRGHRRGADDAARADGRRSGPRGPVAPGRQEGDCALHLHEALQVLHLGGRPGPEPAPRPVRGGLDGAGRGGQSRQHPARDDDAVELERLPHGHREPLEPSTDSARDDERDGRLFDGRAPATENLDGFVQDLEFRLGQRLFRVPSPDGLTSDNLRLISTTQLMGRINFSQRIHNEWEDPSSGIPPVSELDHLRADRVLLDARHPVRRRPGDPGLVRGDDRTEPLGAHRARPGARLPAAWKPTGRRSSRACRTSSLRSTSTVGPTASRTS